MTRADELLRRIKNNKLVSIAIVFGVVVIGLSTFTDAVQNLASVLLPHRAKSPISQRPKEELNKVPLPAEVPYKAPPATDTVFLLISRVRLFYVDPEAPVKVTAYVNGQTFRYPSVANVEWVTVGEGMSPHTFEIPRAERYEVRFEMLINRHETVETLVSQQILRFSTLPYTNTYSLHAVRSSIHEAAVSANVSFSMSGEP
jgi:hypothetical protein